MTEAAKATIVAVLKAHQPDYERGVCRTCGDALLRRTPLTSTEAITDSARRHVADVIIKLLSIGEPPAATIPSRTTDPGTSHKAAAEVRIKAGTQRTKMLYGFWRAGSRGATDEEAAELAEVDLRSEYAKRASELREAGLIEACLYVGTSSQVTRKGRSGMDRIVSQITPAGAAALRQAEVLHSVNAHE